MGVLEFNLPDVGEGLTEAEIVSWKVEPGDTVRVNDVIVEIETAKSAVELPSPYAGSVDRLLVDEGTTVEVGTPIIAVRTDDDAEPSAGADGGTAPGGSAPRPEEQASGELASGEETSGEETSGAQASGARNGGRQAMLVGYGPRSTSAKRRPRKAAVSEAPEEPAAGGTAHRPASVLAKPPVRKLAKDLGVDITTVTPSGPGGTVTREDIQSASSSMIIGTSPAYSPESADDQRITGAGWGGQPREERVPIRSVRKATAKAVTKSAFTAPHVSEFVTVDATRTVKLVDRLRETREFRDVKLTVLAVLAKAMCLAARRTPEVNARWDDDAGEIVFQRYVNLGIAAATPRGLVVPNVKDADQLGLRDLAVAINELAEAARAGSTPTEDMLGGTISITNVGVFGVDTGTPILPPGEAAIMAFGAVRKQPWVHKDKVRPRWVTTLGLSFDHRLVDGEQGSRFLADVAALLEDPANALAWG
ncbi:pyruvate dehydrogenase E2 component (dihydrolipoamide acetyltransferase) [Haloactinopolyspora alba]|uniref:Dihydrolipoamide acetyltransferase component of pyruvate dehydrogenase complex n=1 Tax=Haloactinopolyspora alba TaxID=648780 RepID=A0A2P8EFV9_9ACTN|nr:dihydrolipoamide acetyltransferase family protein [Haloactinopolyspora alba]PSL08355.1 pyruvate dehydrogenase E2 component (dihydrolipoamide acetyltransferase) [Haloactinopolyspora alba]